MFRKCINIKAFRMKYYKVNVTKVCDKFSFALLAAFVSACGI
jgi:hypothetical protein